jgi:ADP-ribose pyrophosphatase YjhB (NUDIX family)
MDTISIARELQAIAQTGLHFTQDKYDWERYERLRRIASDMLASHSALRGDDIYEWSREDFGYATPKVDVRAFVLREGKVLLIREDADAGRWSLPGGWADVNETPSESIVREVEEESGYIVRPIRLLAVLDRERQGHAPPFPYHVYKMFFHCELVGGHPRKTLESSESGFFDENDLPELSAGRVLPAQIAAFFSAVRNGEVGTRFD